VNWPPVCMYVKEQGKINAIPTSSPAKGSELVSFFGLTHKIYSFILAN